MTNCSLYISITFMTSWVWLKDIFYDLKKTLINEYIIILTIAINNFTFFLIIIIYFIVYYYYYYFPERRLQVVFRKNQRRSGNLEFCYFCLTWLPVFWLYGRELGSFVFHCSEKCISLFAIPCHLPADAGTTWSPSQIPRKRWNSKLN